MKKLFLSAMMAALLSLPNVMTAQQTERPSRAECYFGLHFDLHALPEYTDLGKHLSESLADSLVTMVQPDYIQVDCKGHYGYSSYPTEVGIMPESFAKDPMRVMRDVTARHGVSLYVHYTGLYERYLAEHKPHWAQVSAKGDTATWGFLSPFSPYADSVIIPQMKELIDKYDIDGAWVDGDCWAMYPGYDYHPDAVAAFTRRTGITDIPRSKDHEHYPAWVEFMRQGMLDYTNHYCNELHDYKDDFEVCSNWAFGSRMPYPMDKGEVDFISGDMSAINSLYTAAFEGRSMAHQGVPWDLMTWSFVRWSNRQSPMDFVSKTALMLKQEAAEVICLGGGFEVYARQNEDLSFQQWQFPLLAEVSQFCRERKDYCFKSGPVHDVMIYYSSQGHWQESEQIFRSEGEDLERVNGVLKCLLDNQLSVDMYMDHHIDTMDISSFSLIVVPEWKYIDEKYINKLKTYVKNGGHLLIIGAETAHLFEDMLDVEFKGEIDTSYQAYLWNGSLFSSVVSDMQDFVPGPGCHTYGSLHSEMNMRSGIRPAATINSYGKGRVGAIYFGIGTRCLHQYTPAIRDFAGRLVSQMQSPLKLKVEGSHLVHSLLRYKNGKTYCHLINAGGQHADQQTYCYDELPPLGPLSIALRTEHAPKSIVLQPEGKEIEVSYKNGELTFTVDQLNIYSIVEIEWGQ